MLLSWRSLIGAVDWTSFRVRRRLSDGTYTPLHLEALTKLPSALNTILYKKEFCSFEPNLFVIERLLPR
jgi:hypothetical protein